MELGFFERRGTRTIATGFPRQLCCSTSSASADDDHDSQYSKNQGGNRTNDSPGDPGIACAWLGLADGFGDLVAQRQSVNLPIESTIYISRMT